MATRPKQRVLVRWNDDLDKSLLLFITHTCTELGIKIPYDEVARRMGSTFTEGAIQQHISKLRNKMAELNVAPVPAAPKRGAVTVKPSSVYGQKGRAGPAPQQPVASKSQARATGTQADSNTATGPATANKRSGKRKQTTIKRSESDEGPTDDEFGGASDDDFQATPNANGKRGRATGTDRQAPASKKVTTSQPQGLSETALIMKALAEADAQYEATLAQNPDIDPKKAHPIFLRQSIEGAQGLTATAPSTVSHYGQLTQAAGFNGEEEEEEITELDASGRFLVPSYNPAHFSFIQDEHLSPTSISQMPTQVSPYPQFGGSQAQATTNNYSNSFQQVSQPPMTYQNNAFNSNISESNFSNYLLAPQPRLPFESTHMNAQMPPPPYPPATVPAISGYGGIQQPMRNNSMVSNSSQNTSTGPPQTPTFSASAGINSAYQSPFTAWGRDDFNNSTTAPNQMASDWGFDNGVGANHTYDSALFNDTTVGDSFVDKLFS